MNRFFCWLVICIMVISISVSLIGCSASKSSEMAAPQSKSEASGAAASRNTSSATDMAVNDRVDTEEAAEATTVEKDDGGSFSALDSQNVNNNVLGDRKIIFNSFILLEIEDFDANFKKITSMVQNSGIGYLQSSSVRSTKISSNPEKYKKEGSIVLRVSQNKFQNVLDELRGMGTVLDDRTTSEEITDQYYDTKSRAQTFEAERERVLEYLKQAKDLNTMLQLERKLSEITYEIEKLKGSLRKWDNLVDFSTITIELREKLPDDIRRTNTYGDRLLNALVDSFEDTIDALGDFVIGVIRLLPALIILFILFLIFKPFISKFVKKNNIQS
ncbi:DUF4349 domain-containing protein [Petroclostridium sp. X23]|uniref:DUF4349 domain-containing protein n=1 Tax=Petroclostridium sp. X23 TaxID=3045146 RepID=UPI0024AD5BC6|nr:DUF4349 domain-containing protein [Petroclostridium sp. X23]WHH57437.1 DUF4349 domain-containing protein [Petroclostridium sp. X23]